METDHSKQKSRKGRRIVLILVLAAVGLLGAYFALTRVILPNLSYQEALKLCEQGRYQEAISVFSTLDGYKDSAERIRDAAYQAAEQLYREGKLSEAADAFRALGDYKDSAERAADIPWLAAEQLFEAGKYQEAAAAYEALDGYKDSAEKRDECLYRLQRAAMPTPAVGETVKFGCYEQDDDPENGKEEIEWTVLALEGDKALLISKYALDCQPYHDTHGSISWEACSLRKWLNDSFLNEAFSSAHQKRIPETQVPADENPDFPLSVPGNPTVDRVFLLSMPEADRYFDSDEARICVPTPYAAARGLDTYDAVMVDGRAACWWWLRTPGINIISAALVFHSGMIFSSGNGVGRTCNAVRPALWVELGVQG